MIICLCATRNMYPQLQVMINMLVTTQPNLKHIYAFVEDSFETSNNELITFVNVSGYTQITENSVNSKNHWSYISLTRCYFTDLLPNESKVLYLDLDLMIEQDIFELWNTDLQNYEIAGVVDENIKAHNLPYIKNPKKYINSGVLLINLDAIRNNKTDEKIDFYLTSWPLRFPDQDALNLSCKILYLDCKWNSSCVTHISDTPIINHVVKVKPWNPSSRWFPKWVQLYAPSTAQLSIEPY